MIDNTTFGRRTALFHTLGCKLNFAETSTVARLMADRGIVRAGRGETPDIVVVNTCSVTELADKKCRQTIRRLVKKYPGATVLVTGCYAQLKSEEVAGIDGVDIVAGNDRKHLLVDYLDRWMETRRPSTMITPVKDIREFVPSCSRGDRTRYFLKVQDGCDYYCTYCTIPMARGRSRSGTIDDIVGQAREVAAEGGREIVITGVNIGDFGKGRDDSFLDLIGELDRVEGIERYRISSIEPNLLSHEIIDFVARSRSFMPHFHIPLQSGDNDVLKLMHRHYDTELFADRIAMIRRLMPDAFIGIDLIVGARGETEERYRRSVDFVKSLDVNKLHVFPYSERPGTRALAIDEVVAMEERHRRSREMNALSDRLGEAFNRRFIGATRPVLVESRHGKRAGFSGFTDNYLRVNIGNATADMVNRVVNVRITGVDDVDALEMKGVVE